MEIIFGANDRERYKADILEEALVSGKRYAFIMNSGEVFEAEYDWTTIEDDGFIIIIKDVVTSVDWYDGECGLILDVRDIKSVKEL